MQCAMLQRLAVKDAYAKETEVRKEMGVLKTEVEELRRSLQQWKDKANSADNDLMMARSEVQTLKQRLSEKELTLSEHLNTTLVQGREIEELQTRLAASEKNRAELEAANKASEEEIESRFLGTEAGKALIFAEAIKINDAAIDHCRDKLQKVYPELDVSCLYVESDDEEADAEVMPPSDSPNLPPSDEGIPPPGP
jgi:chromosome segregation ATPase